jgi:hypothetical protein
MDIYNAILLGLGNFYVNAQEKFDVYNIYGASYYRVALAFKLYFSNILPEQSLNLVSDYIKESFEHSIASKL